MASSSAPGPDEPAELSSWERRILAGIEEDLTSDDPRFVQAMRRHRTRRAPDWWPVSLRCTVLLVAGLVVLVVAATLVPASWWGLLGLITTVVLVPWILFCATEKRGSG
ncbi:DUF3040 domain-containing protein [Pseudonocardia nigra]|uniref:DUF3040 domain-containing protein n=1 Tax=Pseudonocardia nigra TaxID=1921578 RepID=UPI001C5EB484|nr:DUF3040 domain-containing protein [Pseudonocardia nigra]